MNHLLKIKEMLFRTQILSDILQYVKAIQDVIAIEFSSIAQVCKRSTYSLFFISYNDARSSTHSSKK